MVSLVGAGPGDLGLLTLTALDRLRRADVVIYDRLIGRDVLNLIPRRVERISRKRGSSSARDWEQKELNELMVREANAGKRVVRLKGGDAFLFSRGAEEAEFLSEHGIRFEVVPGVSSALAVPAYAGIPLTHRRYSSSVTIVTGREKGRSQPEWSSIAQGSDVVVILMGAAKVSEIAKHLLSGGRSVTTPFAAIMKGTTRKQRTVITTLEEAAKQGSEGLGIEPPAVIVVGSVVSLRRKLSWLQES